MDSGLIPDRFGEFLTLRDEQDQPVVLGEGGFGVTVHAYREWSADEIEHFAIKILHPDALADPRKQRSFRDEINALRAFEHENLVRYWGSGAQAGSVYLVMGLCAGGDLRRLVGRLGRFTERIALQVILQVCAGLDYAHRKHYLHRDLKPQNILLMEEVPEGATIAWLEDALARGGLCFKIADFGLANKLGQDTGSSGCSPMFASPEQLSTPQQIDFRSDIYSLGMTLWYLVTGSGPLLRPDGSPVNRQEAWMAHTSEVSHTHAFPSYLHAEFRKLLGRMVRKSREERFEGVDELMLRIRTLLERLPATSRMPDAPAPQPAVAGQSGSLASGPPSASGDGGSADYYEPLSQLGRRAVGKLQRARVKQEVENTFTVLHQGTEVALTRWNTQLPLANESERKLADHLSRLCAVTCAGDAPASLGRILDARRFSEEWCVAEEWSPASAPLEAVSTARGRDLSFVEVATLLRPAAEVTDFLHKNAIENALLYVEDIRVVRDGGEVPDRAWMRQSVEKWRDWRLQISALSVPWEYLPDAPTVVSNEPLADLSRLTLSKSFCRLLYRLLEGADASQASDSDASAYENAAKLQSGSNAFLRDGICGKLDGLPASEILAQMCDLEALHELPPRTDVSSRSPAAASASGSASGSGSASALAERPPVEEPVSSFDAGLSAEVTHLARVRAEPLPPAPPPVARDPGSSRSAPLSHWSASEVSAPSVSAAPRSPLEVGSLADDEPGWVISPFGERRRQQVPGPKWKGSQRLVCAETGQLFKLPQRLPPLPAIPIPGRFDAVLTPYELPPQLIPVPLGRWSRGGLMTCPITGRDLLLPEDLALGVAEIVPEKSGVVRSPYGSRLEMEVPAAEWRGGQSLFCPESRQELSLPFELPRLHGAPTPETGCFLSPYAPGQTFRLPAHQCRPGFEFDGGGPLVVPPELPRSWRFEGQVRQGAEPEARSPFLPPEREGWQILGAAEWQTERPLPCPETGREFYLPELPVLTVSPAEQGPAVLSPFAPHAAIAIPAVSWAPGSELALTVPGGGSCRVRIAAESLPPLEAAPAARVGSFTSPYAPARSFPLAAPQCVAGTAFACPFTDRPLVVPSLAAAPWRFTGEVRQTAMPETRSPFVAEDAEAWQPVAAAVWRAGTEVMCRKTRQTFRLPAELPVLQVALGPKAPSVLSPFPPHPVIAIPEEQWQPGAELKVSIVGRDCAIRLPNEGVLPLGDIDPLQSRGLPMGLEPCLRGPQAAVRSPHDAQAWVEVPGKDWRPGKRLLCPDSGQPFWLPEELPPLVALPGPEPGCVLSPYTGQRFEVPPLLWQAGEKLRCPASQGWFVLPPELPLLPGRFTMAQPGAIESPFAPGSFVPLLRRDVAAGLALVCPQTGRSFCLPPHPPELIPEATVVDPDARLVRDPSGSTNPQYDDLPFTVRGEEWVGGGIVARPETGERVRLPAKLQPLPATLAVDRPGWISSPYMKAGTPQRVARSRWRPGKEVACAATGRPLRLPDVLPPLPALISRKALWVAAVAGGGFLLLMGIAAVLLVPESPEPAPRPSPVAPHLVPKPVIPAPPVIVPPPPPVPVEPPPLVWPTRFEFRRGIDPVPMAGSATITLSPDLGFGPLPWRLEKRRVIVELPAALQGPALAEVRDLRLVVSMPGYVPGSVPLSRGTANEPGVDLEGLDLKREMGKVTFSPAGRPLPYYTRVRFRDADRQEQILSLDSGGGELSAGTYSVTLLPPVEVEDEDRFRPKVLTKAFQVSSGPSPLPIPAFEFPLRLGGVMGREFEKVPVNVVRGVQQMTYNIKLKAWTPVLVAFDNEQFNAGHFYELNSVAMDGLVRTLDQLSNVAIQLDPDRSPTETAKIGKELPGLLGELMTEIETPLEAASEKELRAQRERQRNIARAIRQHLAGDAELKQRFAKVPQWSEFMESLLPFYEWELALLHPDKDAAWLELLKAGREGAPLKAAALASLTAPVGKRAGLLVDNRFTVIGYDGASKLSLRVERYDPGVPEGVSVMNINLLYDAAAKDGVHRWRLQNAPGVTALEASLQGLRDR